MGIVDSTVSVARSIIQKTGEIANTTYNAGHDAAAYVGRIALKDTGKVLKFAKQHPTVASIGVCAATGAAYGSVVPGVGTTAGAVVGGVSGAAGSIFAQKVIMPKLEAQAK